MAVCGSEVRLSVYTLNEKYDFDPVMQQSPRLFDEHFCLPPHGRPRDAPCFRGKFKKKPFRQSYLFGLQKAVLISLLFLLLD